MENDEINMLLVIPYSKRLFCIVLTDVYFKLLLAVNFSRSS